MTIIYKTDKKQQKNAYCQMNGVCVLLIFLQQKEAVQKDFTQLPFYIGILFFTDICHVLSASKNLCIIAAISALDALSDGLIDESVLPFISPVPTAYWIGAMAYSEILS